MHKHIKKRNEIKGNSDGRDSDSTQWGWTKDELEGTALEPHLIQQHQQADQTSWYEKQNEHDRQLLSRCFSNVGGCGVLVRWLLTGVQVYRDNASTLLLPLYGGS